MSARKTPMLVLAAVTLGLTLTACGNGGDGGGPYDALASNSPTATAPSTAQSPTADEGTTTGGTSSDTPKGVEPGPGGGGEVHGPGQLRR
ncbi:hypothetical protein RKD37_005120 [Streptomyces ambofaciens]